MTNTKHDCCGHSVLIEYDGEYKEWHFLETEYGPIITTILYCPWCGVELLDDGNTIDRTFLAPP